MDLFSHKTIYLYHHECDDINYVTRTVGFEPTRSLTIAFRMQLLNLSDKHVF